MKVAFCASEAVPYVKTGGLADVIGSLPKALSLLDIDVTIILPLYQEALRNVNGLIELSPGFFKGKVNEHFEVVFVQSNAYFNRPGLYGSGQYDYQDNLERFQFYSQRCVKYILEDENFDIVHCHDWQSALIPAYLKTQKDVLNKKTLKSVLTIHNLAFQGVFPKEKFCRLLLDEKYFSEDYFAFYDQINLLKGGMAFADELTTVSPRYAKEIQTDEFGCGLGGFLTKHQDKLAGIVNGIDEVYWDPQKDPYLVQTYNDRSFTKGKMANKSYLYRKAGFKGKPADSPLFGFVGRLTHQKGLDLLIEVLPGILEQGSKVVIQGLGESKYIQALAALSQEFPKQFTLYEEFNEELAHRIYAGSDFFLMPSVFEPCGLSQLISMRYGTIPLVYEVGGLADTVADLMDFPDTGSGLKFATYTTTAFLKKIQEAQQFYNNSEYTHAVVSRIMKFDLGWEKAACEYKKLYQCLLSD